MCWLPLLFEFGGLGSSVSFIVGFDSRQWGVLFTARLAGVCFGLVLSFSSTQLSPVPPVGVPWRVLIAVRVIDPLRAGLYIVDSGVNRAFSSNGTLRLF